MCRASILAVPGGSALQCINGKLGGVVRNDLQFMENVGRWRVLRWLFRWRDMHRARELHVAKTGSNANSGSLESPYLTIGKAAEAAQPGDTVTVHGGTYREWVKPPRGGRDENSRITYRAAAGEEVLIKGSERITSWVDQGGGVWMVQLPQRFFGDYNPYALNLSGGWLHYGQWLHRGDVYLDGQAFCERKTLEEVKQQAHTWCCRTAEDSTTIWAHFGEANPNAQLAEINVRESVFMPAPKRPELHHRGRLSHPALCRELAAARPQQCRWERSARGWASRGSSRIAPSPMRVAWASFSVRRPGVDHTDIDAFGAHVVRNNVVRRCGQAGIAGQKGATRCLIAGNLIEDTNYRKEFGGWETAAVKFHESVDTVIRGNLIRGVYHQGYGAFGIWMDWGNQGTRITGNIIYNTQAANIFLEMDHGPILVDNNVLIGQGVRASRKATCSPTTCWWTARSRWLPTRAASRSTTGRTPGKWSPASPAFRRTTSGSTTFSFAGAWTA